MASVQAKRCFRLPVVHRLALVLVGLLPLLAVAAEVDLPEELAGKVIGVHDGDTLTVLVGEKTVHRIRLEGIDAPELKQPFGSRSKQALSKLCFGKQVRVKTNGKDRYNRILGEVFVGDIDVNLRMVSLGMAWQYREYSNSRELDQAETKARETKIGSWAGTDPIAPWEWRKTEKERRTAGQDKPSDKPPPRAASGDPVPATRHWLNTASKARHNAGCRYFKNTKAGDCAARMTVRRAGFAVADICVRS